jgi:hypothetical protein
VQVDICGTSSKPYFVGVTAVTNLDVTAVTDVLRARTRWGRRGNLPTAWWVDGGRLGHPPSTRAIIFFPGFRRRRIEASLGTA